MGISTRALTKAFGATRVLHGIDLDVADGEMVALLGPSGGGKSTLLRVIAGLEPVTTGEVWLDGNRVDHLDAASRGVGFVFQHYALFRHMTVRDNVAFGLKVRGVPRVEAADRANRLLDRVGLRALGERYPDELSGGQRQRVALARALAPEPRVLLLDEPFGALDAQVRDELRTWLRRLHDEVGATTVLVTHDQEEALAVADRIVIVRDGRVAQTGTPTEIVDDPATEFVARFVGEVNVFDGEVDDGHVAFGPVRAPVGDGWRKGQRVRVVIRSHELRLLPGRSGAVVTRVVPMDDRARVELSIGGRALLARVARSGESGADRLAIGSTVGVEVLRARAWDIEPR